MLDGSGQRWQVFSPLTTEIPAVLLSVRSFVPSFIEVQCCPLLPLRHLLCFSYSFFFWQRLPRSQQVLVSLLKRREPAAKTSGCPLPLTSRSASTSKIIP